MAALPGGEEGGVVTARAVDEIVCTSLDASSQDDEGMLATSYQARCASYNNNNVDKRLSKVTHCYLDNGRARC